MADHLLSGECLSEDSPITEDIIDLVLKYLQFGKLPNLDPNNGSKF